LKRITGVPDHYREKAAPKLCELIKFYLFLLYKQVCMKASMGSQVREALSSYKTAKVLTAAIIANNRNGDVVRVNGALPNGKMLVLKRISLKDR
jgi:hypothetical protein